MKQAVCGKMTPVAYQNVEIGKGPGTVVYKVGPKVGLQQCGTGTVAGTGGVDVGAGGGVLKIPNHLESDSAAAWNIIALSMYIRSQSPDSNSSALSPSSHLNSLPLRTSEVEKVSLSTCTSNLYQATNLSRRSSGSSAVADDGTLGLSSSGDKNVGADLLKQIPSGSGESWSQSVYSSDEDKSYLSNYSWGDEGVSLMLPYQSHWGTLESSDRSRPTSAREQSSSSTSSIGECEDSSCSSADASTEGISAEMEVESIPRGGPLSQMGALESSLPIKRGLSKFWSGKSKSFTSLAAVSSIEDLAKPEDPYARRRRITNSLGDRHKSFPPLSRSSTSGISKRPTSTSGSRSGLAMAFAMGSKLEESPKLSPPKHCVRSISLMDLAEGRSFQYSNARVGVAKAAFERDGV